MVKLGRGTLKKLLFLMVITLTLTALSAQEESVGSGVDETTLVIAADDAQSTIADEEGTPPSVGFADLLRVILVLACLIGVIYFLLAFLKKMSPLSESANEDIRILSTRHVRRDSSLHLVEVGNQVFLIGSTPNNLNFMSEITDKESLDRIKLNESEESSVSTNNFRSLIRNSLAQNSTKKRVHEESPHFLNRQSSKLRELRGEE